MKKLIISILLVVTGFTYGLENSALTEETVFEVKGPARMSCSAVTGGAIARFNRCVRGTEVMTGIQSLEPLMVYCSNLIVNCHREEEEKKSVD
ncbi:MAG: hypothetical protein EBZ49_12435 [Proteobacteria bacterium]|nr:hypothetical protein [Pseudomonadota bacterium]NDC24915.1 hypothetical protein [Pseudomonadota bacterium]